MDLRIMIVEIWKNDEKCDWKCWQMGLTGDIKRQNSLETCRSKPEKRHLSGDSPSGFHNFGWSPAWFCWQKIGKPRSSHPSKLSHGGNQLLGIPHENGKPHWNPYENALIIDNHPIWAPGPWRAAPPPSPPALFLDIPGAPKMGKHGILN